MGGRTRTTWKPGQVTNPNGRPKCPLKEAIQEALAEKIPIVGEDGKTRKMVQNEAIIRVAMKMALAGNVKAMELLWERGYGKAMQPLDIEGRLEHGVPAIQIEVISTKRGEGASSDQ